MNLDPMTEKEKEDILFRRLIGIYDWITMEYEVHASTMVNGINRFKREVCERLNKEDDNELTGENYD